MGLDHSRAIARIFFDGLMVFCFNDDKSVCQVGMIKNGEHHRDLTITEIMPSGHRRNVRLGDYGIHPARDLVISVVNPEPSAEQIIPYYGTESFNRNNDTGDPEDFRWAIDLESAAEFHQLPLNLKREGFKSKLELSHGYFHTVRKTRLAYGRVTLPDLEDPRFLGKLAHNVGVDIRVREDIGKVIIKNRGATGQLELPRPLEEGETLSCTYEILIENSCAPQTGPRRSDFPLFYEAVNDPGGVKYDLRIAAREDSELGNGCPPFADRPEFRLDGEPQVCQQGFLGIKDDLET